MERSSAGLRLERVQREFPNFEVMVATKIDTDHLHSHLVVSSVSFQRCGKKLHQSAAEMANAKNFIAKARKFTICFRNFNLNETDDVLLCGEKTEKANSATALPD